MQRDDCDLIRLEFEWAADMLRHACRRGIWAVGKGQGHEDNALRNQLAEDAQSLIAEYKQIWHARNRPGGFKESSERMEKLHSVYL